MANEIDDILNNDSNTQQEPVRTDDISESKELDSLLSINDSTVDVEHDSNTDESSEVAKTGSNKEGVDKPEDNQDKSSDNEDVENEISEAEKTTVKRVGVKDAVSSLLEDGTWTDMSVKVGDKEYNSISELLDKEKNTRELFNSLSEAQKNIREESLKSEYIRVKDLDETKQKLITAISNGVSVDDLIKSTEQHIEPIKSVDFSTIDPKSTENFVSQCLLEYSNFPKNYLELEIDRLKKSNELIGVANQYQSMIVQNHNDEIDRRIKETQEQNRISNEKWESDYKTFNSTLSQKGYSGGFAQKAADLRYRLDESNVPHYQRYINDKLQDEAFAVDLMHFLLDKEDYIKKQTVKAKTESTKRVLELAKFAPKKSSSTLKTQDTVDNNDDISSFMKKANLI